ncbi:MAG TPA: LPXTG cell wall anchor domain-containing protein, partial [Clostridia bacterium]|nr:LPXTG cell wall anchor domain-containing protein [Clostridia bacterium]
SNTDTDIGTDTIIDTETNIDTNTNIDTQAEQNTRTPEELEQIPQTGDSDMLLFALLPLALSLFAVIDLKEKRKSKRV